MSLTRLAQDRFRSAPVAFGGAYCHTNPVTIVLVSGTNDFVAFNLPVQVPAQYEPGNNVQNSVVCFGEKMSMTIDPQPVPLSRDADDVIRINGTRVTLDIVVESFIEGATAEEIVHQYPTLQLADVRVRTGRPMPGVFEVSRKTPIGDIIDDFLLIADASLPQEWEGQVRYLPLR